MIKHKQLTWFQGLLILGVIWLAGAIADRVWFAFDRAVPAWDQADYLNGALNYWNALQTPRWFDGEWWRNFWLLSPKIPPLTYLLTVPFLTLFGTSPDAATLIMLPLSAILLVSVYSLGTELFNVSVGLWAAGLCQLLPGLYYYRLEFLLDYPLTTVVTLSFCLLTLGNFPHKRKKENLLLHWVQAVIFGISLGLALMVKQTALFFLLIPILWTLGTRLLKRQWGRLAQLISSLGVSILIFYPWYRTNWLLMLTSGKRATVDSAIAEGDPSLNTLAAWTYYGKILPYLLSWPLLLIPIVGLLIYLGRKYWLSFPPSPPVRAGWETHPYTASPPVRAGWETHPYTASPPVRAGWETRPYWTWIGIFLLGGYFLSSLNINKDARYILPLLPVFSLVLAAGLLAWKGRWQHAIRTGTIVVGILLMLLNLFPLGGAFLTQILSPHTQHYPYLGQPWPHEAVIAQIIQTSPYLRSTLGVLPSTPEINQHNFSYYGKRAQSQVAGRQVGVHKQEIEQDARSLDWFVTKTGAQGSVPEAQATMVQRVEQGTDFQLQQRWHLSDRTTLKLYHRTLPSIQVRPFPQSRTRVQLERAILPEKAPPGFPIPVTYEWSGAWEQLQSGIVLLTWQHEKSCGDMMAVSCPFQHSFWLHDRGIGMGALHPGNLKANQISAAFSVIERTAMFVEHDVVPGNYRLSAVYLNRETGETYPIQVPPLTVTLDSTAAATPAPELDLVTQLRRLAPDLSQGLKGLKPIFAQIARINQYDPLQDYLVQSDRALSYRLKQQQNLDWAYTVALARVLQQDIKGAIAAWQQVIQLDAANPYPYAYLAFVYLYDWHPHEAQKVLQTALKLNPNLPELQALNGIATLMQGNFIKAWQELSRTLPLIF